MSIMKLPFAKEAIKNLFSKSSCAMYPVRAAEAAPGYRGRISYDPTKCVGCGMCEKVCAAGAITRKIQKISDISGDRITLTFNMGSCTFCSTCADFCTHGAISLTTDYHMIATKEEDLLVSGGFIKAPIKRAKPADGASASSVKPREDGKPVNDPEKCVYCTLCAKKCPAGALEVDRAAKTWKLDDEKCLACGNCAEACPKKCIIM